MNSNLLDILVDRGIINEQTEFEARLGNVDISGMARSKFEGVYTYVAHFSDEDGTGSVIAESTFDGRQVTIPMGDIFTVDGMDPVRFGSIYALGPKGETLKMAARRGRKPKNRATA